MIEREPHVAIRYIGVAPSVLNDNVLRHSGRSWPNRGAIVRLPEREAYLYLKHPDMYEVCGAEFVASTIEHKVANRQQVEILTDLVDFLALADAKALLERVQARVTELEGAPAPQTAYVPPTPAEANHQAIRVKKIADVLPTLNKKDKNDFSTQGIPRVSRVQELTKLVPEVTGREIAAARALLEQR